ncbi:MAG: riboflavin synthase [Bacteroidota bacterium]|nr:riboflavin synthase [Bacteroidota bacterium]
MFTGIVKEIGTVKSVRRHGDGRIFEIAANTGVDIDNSIAVNGTCLTVTSRRSKSFTTEAMRETLLKTTLSFLKIGSPVNVERAISLKDLLGGHLVLGHVDTVGRVKRVTKFESSWLVSISFPAKFRKYLIPVGSVAVDGVSVTVARLHGDSFEVAVIPYTMEHTIFQWYRAGTNVNLEFDVLGKYVEQLLSNGFLSGQSSASIR